MDSGGRRTARGSRGARTLFRCATPSLAVTMAAAHGRDLRRTLSASRVPLLWRVSGDREGRLEQAGRHGLQPLIVHFG